MMIRSRESCQRAPTCPASAQPGSGAVRPPEAEAGVGGLSPGALLLCATLSSAPAGQGTSGSSLGHVSGERPWESPSAWDGAAAEPQCRGWSGGHGWANIGQGMRPPARGWPGTALGEQGRSLTSNS